MKKVIEAFITTLLVTLLFSITGNSLIIMYIILLTELYLIISDYKNQIKKKKMKLRKKPEIIEQNKVQNIEKYEQNYTKSKNITKKNQKISYAECKEKVKIKTYKHKR